MSDYDDKPHASTPSLWPIGFAIGIACLLVGLVVSVTALVLGAIIALIFGFLWVRDLMRAHGPITEATEGAGDEDAVAAPAPATETGTAYDRSDFLAAATIGVGALIGAAITLPVLGFAVLPSFEGDNVKSPNVDLGPISNFPEGTFVIAQFIQNTEQGDVSRRTAYVRNNGFTTVGKEPSFTILYSRCVHLGCPVQANGPVQDAKRVVYKTATLTPVLPAGFGCPCHGGQYNTEGNRTAGPPVRSLDRYEFSIVHGHLVLGRLFSVGHVEGAGADAKLSKYYHAYPGVHVDGIESWLYPIPTPGTT